MKPLTERSWNSLQSLQEVGSVVYRTRSGDRKRYFRKDFEDWETRSSETPTT